MANNLRKFNTYSDYEAAVLVKPAVSLIAATDEVIFDQKDAPVPPTPTFSGLTVHYNITDISQPTELFRGGGGSGSGSGFGSGGVIPSAMIIDGTAVEVTNIYQFSTTGEHIVNYSFADNAMPNNFFEGEHYTYVTKVEIGDSITSIGGWAFEGCSSLTSCTIGSGVTSIGDSAFEGCSSLTSVDIPDSVTSIGNYAFENCSSLTSIDIPSGVTSIGSRTFERCSSLTSITVDSNNTIYDSRNNCNAIIESSSNKLIVGCKNTVIPNSVTTIGEGAFNHCSGLTSIVIPSSVTTIDSSAFIYCKSLTSCTIGSGVTSIGNSAFRKCGGLTSIICNATTAPTITATTFQDIKTDGTLTVPQGSSGYDTWMQNANYYLGLYNWTKVEQ